MMVLLLPGGPGILIPPGGGGRIPIGPEDTLLLALDADPDFFWSIEMKRRKTKTIRIMVIERKYLNEIRVKVNPGK